MLPTCRNSQHHNKQSKFDIGHRHDYRKLLHTQALCSEKEISQCMSQGQRMQRETSVCTFSDTHYFL